MRELQTCGLWSLARVGIVVCLVLAAAAIPSSAQTFSIVASLDGFHGADPEYGPLAQGRDGNFYGTTYSYLSGGCETIFKVTPPDEISPAHCFGVGEGSQTWAGLVLGTDGNFYGTAGLGGTYTWGIVYKWNPSTDLLTTLHSFCAPPNCADGAYPVFALMQASNGIFYGTTQSAPAAGNASGTLFQVTMAGKFKTLYSFCSQPNCTDGQNPGGPLIEGTDGYLYGTTAGGGYGYGTIFRLNLTGKPQLTTLYRFTNQTDGSSPNSPLVQAADGNFYGTTLQGGIGTCAYGCGIVFKMTPDGVLTTLHYFDFTDGGYDVSGLVQGTDGNFYGATEGGGCGAPCNGFGGTVFQMLPDGTLTTLHLFTGPPDGSHPAATLIQSTNGKFYGQAIWGGDSTNCGSVGCGAVFSEDMGLGPFVQALTYAGKVGKVIEILGQGFTKSTKVFFNGTPTTRSVKSGTYLTAKVPIGATTGYITVVTDNGTLSSNKVFRVIP